MKCKKHKIEKKLNLGGVMFCEKCIEKGLDALKGSRFLKGGKK